MGLRTHNNRKQTLGRKFLKRTVEIITGFTVYAEKLDKQGKKTNNRFKEFVAVKEPEIKVKSKDPTNVTKRKKQAAWHDNITAARLKAFDIANVQSFECHIKRETVKQDIILVN